MYNETDLDLVGTTMDIWTRAPKENRPRNPKRGHFDCTECVSKPMGARPHYSTVSVVNFAHDPAPIFNFIFSQDDTWYIERQEVDTKNRIVRGLIRSRHNDWVYCETDELDTLSLHVRGWWDNEHKFIHNTGNLLLSTFVDITKEEEDEIGNLIDPEFAFHVFKPVHAGMYIHYANAEMYEAWNAEDIFDKTYVHPAVDDIYAMKTPIWNKRPVIRAKKKRSKTTRQYRTATQQAIERDITEGQITQFVTTNPTRRTWDDARVETFAPAPPIRAPFLQDNPTVAINDFRETMEDTT